MKPELHGGKVNRAEPESEHHCSPVLRRNVAPTGDAAKHASNENRRLTWTVRSKSFDSSSVTTLEQAAAVVAAMGAGGRVDGSPAARPLAPPVAPGLSKMHKSPRNKNGGILQVYRNASFMQLSSRSDASGPEGGEIGGKRGEIGHFTDASRRRMLACLAKIENDQVPWFVTCTYPDEFDKFALYREEYKRHLELLCKRIERRFPAACCLWKLEFMPRKSGVNKGKIAPHYHIFLFGVPWAFEYREMVTDHVRLIEITPGYWDESVHDRGEWVKTCASYVHTAEGLSAPMIFKSGDVANADGIREWMARNWFDIVGTGLIEHFRAGTGVEMLRSKGGAFAYASKLYAAKSEEVVLTGAKPGRFWGVVGRKNLKFGRRDVLELTHEQSVKLRRTMRRYRVAKCPPEKRGKMRKGQLFSADYTVKLSATVEFWMERLPALIGSAPRLRQAGAKRLFTLLI